MALPTEDVLLYSMLAFIVVENFIEIYLSLRQVKVYKESKKVPAELVDTIKPDTFEKARVYGLDKEQFSIFKSIITDVIIVSLEFYFGFLSLVWHKSQVFARRFNWDHQNEIIISCIFMIILNSLNLFKDLPFKIYGTFVLEEQHGFNKQTAMFFIKDQIKGFVVGQFISIPISCAVIWIVQRGGDYFFVWLWLFTGVLTLVLMTLYPVFIAPLFDKYSPLEVGPLRTSIEELAAKLKFPLAQLYVVEGSKRSAHSNAYFYGLWGSKRIVLFDTLLVNKGKTQTTEGVDNTNETEKLTDDEHSKSRTLLKQTLRAESEEKETENFKENYNENVGKGCKDEEVLAVLAHELGHWKLGHVTKNIIFMQFHLLLMFVTFAYLFKYDPLYRAVGFRVGERPVLVGLLLIVSYVLGPYNALINFLMTIVSRTFEYQADAFANDLGYSKELAKALIKLNIDNLGFPVYDWMYSAWNHSHPTLLQRIDRLKDINNDIKKSN
ncbi:CAAX prenyl protease 1 homolog isoform X1 [Contarinia nasturtii]|uniref:CAAX prenyl protease 1 homolog isoform X1 n=1 Tax=Contarinia nasturtii TaxID=265458 RepID=UPI0012D3929D|nr:CAAX prenyl protease 1 homolog isoform X1 [Contarinia nasturtii]